MSALTSPVLREQVAGGWRWYDGTGRRRRWVRSAVRLGVIGLSAIVLGLLLGGCGGSSSPGAAPSTSSAGTTTGSSAGSTATTSSTKPVQPPPPAPSTAQCRTLTYADTSVFTNDTNTEPCSSPHTAYTYAVPTLPPTIAFKGVLIQNSSVQSAAADRCRAAFGTFIGGDLAGRALSRLTFTYFLPDQQGFDLGAHWVRCDVVARESAKTLGDLPKRVAGLLNTDGALDKYGVCSDGTPGNAAHLVMCTQGHTYRALAAIRLGAPEAAYPGTGTTLSDGRQHCQALIAHQLGVTGGFTYAWTYPSSDDWAAGQRYGYCWNETAH